MLLFFALTRTQVGRNELRDELERQFAASFDGQLEIERLTGNLVNDLFASNVRVLDDDGRVVAQVDSVVASLAWRDLFRRRVSLSQIRLIEPEVFLVYRADSTWNLIQVFQRERPASAGGDPWTITSADVVIEDGTVHTHHEASPPPLVEHEHLFNFANSELRQLNLRATVEWRSAFKLVDVLSASAYFPEQKLRLEAMEGQALLEADDLSLNQVLVEFGTSRLRLDGSVANLNSLRADSLDAVLLDVEMTEGVFDFSELRRVFPSLPLADRARASASLSGPLSMLKLDGIFERGNTRLAASGTARNLAGTFSFEGTLQENTLDLSDLRALLPDLDLPEFNDLGTLRFTVDIKRLARPSDRPQLEGEVELDVQGSPGRVYGTFAVVPDGRSTPRLRFDVRTEALDLARLLDDDELRSDLNGHLRWNGYGTTLATLEGLLEANLRTSSLAGRQVDTLHLETRMQVGLLEGGAFAQRGAELVRTNGRVDLRDTHPAYRLGISTRNLNLGTLLQLDSVSTDLNLRASIKGRGVKLAVADADLTLAFDTSTVRYRNELRGIAPHTTYFSLNRRHPEAPWLHLSGDVATLEIDGTEDVPVLMAVTSLWSDALVQATKHTIDKPYVMPAKAYSTTLPPISHRKAQAYARAALTEASLDAVDTRARLDLHRADILSAFLPMIPRFESDISAVVRLRADSYSFDLDGTLTTDRSRLATVRADIFEADLRASASLDRPFIQTLEIQLDARADTLHMGAQVIPAPSVTLNFQDERAQIRLTTGRTGRAGPARLAASVNLLPDRNRLTLEDFSLALGDYVWKNPADEPVDLYADAIVIPRLRFESASSTSRWHQQIQLSGRISSAPTDTIQVHFSDIGLRQLSGFFNLKRPLSGRMNGRLAFTGAEQPELTGALSVDAFAFDNRVLGSLRLSSRYLPGTPNIGLDLRLAPLENVPADYPTLPDRSWIVEHNSLRLVGQFRLPAGQNDAGSLDLKLDAERADAFFFEYLFPTVVSNVEGGIGIDGRVGGTFRKPHFEAQVKLEDALLHVPKFNLSYSATGVAHVDDSGIHIDGVRLRDKTGGAASLSGSVLFNDYRFFSLDLAAELDDLQIIDVAFSDELAFYGHIWASGDATITGPLSNTLLSSSNVVTSGASEIFIPLVEETGVTDPGFIIFADSSGTLPDLSSFGRRESILGGRPTGERTFISGLDMDLNIFAPQGSTVHLVIDPTLGDVINAVGSGRIQLQLRGGEFFTYGLLDVDSGDYLFSAGDVFVRRFLIDDGTIEWDGDPVDARLNIDAAYRTRASKAGLPPDLADRLQPLLPLVVDLNIAGRASAPIVRLRLAVDRSTRDTEPAIQLLESYLNQPERTAELATSVLLTNSFLLTTDVTQLPNSDVLASSAVNSVSQLVANQLNRYLNEVVPNADFNFGLQSDEGAQDLDVSAGLALRLLDERLVIRGQGVYQGLRTDTESAPAAQQQRLEGEFVVEVRLSPTVSVEVFYRREGDVLSESVLTSTTGAGLSYQTDFSTWRALLDRLLGFKEEAQPSADTTTSPAAPVVISGDE